MYFVKCLLAVSILGITSTVVSATEAKFRRPLSVALSKSEDKLFTANRDSATVSVIDTASSTIVEEIPVGGRPVDIVSPSAGQLLVLDERHHQVIRLKHDGTKWQVATRISVSPYPVRIVLGNDSRHCYVSSLWSRTVSMIELSVADDDSALRLVNTLRLPFEPRELCLFNEGESLIVASAFDAGLAVIETDELRISSLKDIPGHNIRGLAVDDASKQLLIAQQELNPLARSSRDDVHWGNMISNVLVSIPFEQINHDESERIGERVVTQLGEPGAATGDPGGITFLANDKVAVLLSGVHEVAVADREHLGDNVERVAVGKRPVAVASSSDGRLFVANLFSDSISVVNLRKQNQVRHLSLGAQPEMSLAQRGEMLFFDGTLSHDGWMSCHSCHTDGHSNLQLNDNLSDGSFGAAKRVLSLLGVADTKPWAWNGEVKSLEDQVVNSIEKTMQGSTPDEQQVAALVAYIKTLSLPDETLADKELNTANVERGRALFGSLGCAACHAPPTYTTPKSYNVGLIDQVGNERFNPPSLRGVANRRSFFHDGRAKSIEEVLTKHKHQLSNELADGDLDSLIEFLRTLNTQRS